MTTTAEIDAVGLGRALAAGERTAQETVEEHLARIAASDLNAVVTVDPDARVAAAASDARRAAGRALGPLDGVPFTVKDTVDVAGLRSTAGSRALADHVATRTATSVQRLQDAGAVLLGKTNCSEFAVDTHTDNPLFGATLNPLDHRRTPGGSSGGESAAVAGGLSAFGVGTDFGGSIRWPAHCTGLVSLRATPGAVPADGLLPFSAVKTAPSPDLLLARLMTVAPIARSVRDVALAFAVMSGRLPRPELSDAPPAPVAWASDEGTVPVRADVRAAVRRAAEALAAGGAEVTQDHPPGLEKCAALFVAIRDAQGLPEVEAVVADRLDRLGPQLRDYVAATSRRRRAADITADLQELNRVRERVLQFLDRHPLLLLPVASVSAPAPAEAVDVDGVPVPWSRLGSCCRAVSVLGLPVVAVPCGTDDAGFPVAVQVVGRPGAEAEVLRAALLVERAGAPVTHTRPT